MCADPIEKCTTDSFLVSFFLVCIPRSSTSHVYLMFISSFAGLPLFARHGILPDDMLDEMYLVPPRMHNLMYAFMFGLSAGCSLLEPRDQHEFLEGFRRNEQDVGKGNLSLAMRRAGYLSALNVLFKLSLFLFPRRFEWIVFAQGACTGRLLRTGVAHRPW